MLVDPGALRQALIAIQGGLDGSHAERPSLLFAIHGPADAPSLEYLLQLPGYTSERLLDLVSAGVRAGDHVLGLALAVCGEHVDLQRVMALPVDLDRVAASDQLQQRLEAVWGAMTPEDGQMAPANVLVAILRDGYTLVVASRRGGGVHIVEHVPQCQHEEVSGLIFRLLVGDQVPVQRRPQDDGGRARIA